MSPSLIEKALNQETDPIQAQQLSRFFKTGIGEYGEGDQFLGIKVPVLRKIAKPYPNLTLHEIRALLHTNIHEKRFLALAILVNQYQRNVKKPEQIALFYLKHKSVDSTH